MLYTWHSIDGPSAGESAWSVLNKFCYRNAIGINQLISHLNFVIKDSPVAITCRTDLRFNTNGLIHYLHVATKLPFEEKRMTLEYLTLNNDMRHMRLISSSSLRFCPICIKMGYHSTVNQLLFKKTCPVHYDIFLEDKCPKCGLRIPYLPPTSCETSYACPSCKFRLWLPRNDYSIKTPTTIALPIEDPFSYRIPISFSFFGFPRSAYIAENLKERFLSDASFFLNYKEGECSPFIERHYTVQSSLIKSDYENKITEMDYFSRYKSIDRHIQERFMYDLGNFKSTSIRYAYRKWSTYWNWLLGNNKGNIHASSIKSLISAMGYRSFFINHLIATLNSFPAGFRENLAHAIFSIMCHNSFREFLIECITYFGTPVESRSNKCTPELREANDGSVFFIVEKRGGSLKIHFFLPKGEGDVIPFDARNIWSLPNGE